MRARSSAWCLAVTEDNGVGFGGDGERRWLDLVESELPTVRLRLADFAEYADAVSGLELTTAVARYWLRRGPLSEALAWFQTFTALDRGGLTKAQQGVAAGWIHRLHCEMGEPIALTELRRSVVATALADSARDWFRSADHLAEALVRHSDNHAEAVAVVDAAIERAEAAHDRYWLGLFLLRRAYLHASMSASARYEELIGYVEEPLAVGRSNHQGWIVAQSQFLSAVLRIRERDWTGARTMMTPALDTMVRYGDRLAAVLTMSCMSAVLIELDEPVGAAHWLREAIVDAQRIDFGHGELFCAWGVAFLAVAGPDGSGTLL